LKAFRVSIQDPREQTTKLFLEEKSLNIRISQTCKTKRNERERQRDRGGRGVLQERNETEEDTTEKRGGGALLKKKKERRNDDDEEERGERVYC